MGKKKRGNLGKIKGFSIQFMPFSEIANAGSSERIKKSPFFRDFAQVLEP